MCTALHLPAQRLFGRTLDLDRSYGEEVCVTPRYYPWKYRCVSAPRTHYALIGMATVVGNTPLYYDAANEYGLCMAGLNFPGNAFYPEEVPGKDNVAPFEFIPWLLGQCRSLSEARQMLRGINLVNIPFGEHLPLSPLHWIIGDSTGALVVEPTREGLQVYENPVGVLTNNPPFPFHLQNLNNYRALSVSTPASSFGTELEVYCQGLGGLGLPGDVSSMSRFVRAAFQGLNARFDGDRDSQVEQFFHALGSVEMVRGLCRTEDGHWDITVYTGCVDARLGRYYYTSYHNRRITCVDMYRSNLNGRDFSRHPVRTQPDFLVET